MHDGTANTLEETPIREKKISDYMEGVFSGWASALVIVIAYYWMV